MILLPTIGGLLGFFYSKSQDTIYEAGAIILVQHRGSGFVPGTSDFRRSQELAATYRRLLTANPFLKQARQNSAITDIGGEFGSVSASTDSNPPVLNVRARHRDPTVAAITAQVVAEEFIDYAIEQRLAEIARLQSAAAAQGITNFDDLVAAQLATVDSLSLLESVTTPESPVLPRTRQNIILGSLLGLVLAAGGALLLESLRDTVRFPDQLARRFGATGLGTVFKWTPKEVAQGELVLQESPTSSYAEAFRQIRANLQFAFANHPSKVLLVSSPGPGEGKSTIICNLAIALAQTGKRVIVVDGDLRRPAVHRLFNGVDRDPGLSNFLADLSTDLAEVVHPTAAEGVEVMPAGPTPPNPAELLGSPKMNTLLSQLKSVYDTVLVDSPPLLLVADGSLVASQMDGVIVVVDGFGTRSSSLQAALDTLRNTNVNIVGVIINKLKRARFGYGYTYPYYYYYSDYKYYTDSDEMPVNGTGRFYSRLTQQARRVWSRLRRD